MRAPVSDVQSVKSLQLHSDARFGSKLNAAIRGVSERTGTPLPGAGSAACFSRRFFPTHGLISSTDVRWLDRRSHSHGDDVNMADNLPKILGIVVIYAYLNKQIW
jgi:hypothetical protein